MSVVDEIKSRLDIVDTVSGYAALQRSGRNFKALCPFHTEKTPSFVVNPERQSWRCFGACATGGDVFSFLMRMEGLDFGEALRLLAAKAGVTLASKTRDDKDLHEPLYRINQEAARFYQEVLASAEGRRGMTYLEGRGLDQEAVSRFELGLSPDSWDRLKSHLVGLGFAEDQAAQAGLLYRRDGGATRDFFRGRLMFPIHDRKGRIAGFGARAMDDSMPKYLNTSKTPVFDKRSILYGLHLAAGAIKTQDRGIVVEGYMDVIAAHQLGYTNVVASMGTALTERQVSQLRSLASSFVLALDPDTAGREATLRALESTCRVFERQAVDSRRRSVGVLYQREPMDPRIAALPAGKDPDRLIREDAGEWERLVRESMPFRDFYLEMVSSRFDLSTPQGKSQAVQAMLPLITSADFFQQEHYLQRMAGLLEVSEDALKASIGGLRRSVPEEGRRRRDRGPSPEISVSPLLGDPKDALEEYMLALLLNRPELKERVHDFAPEYLHRSEDREVFAQWFGCSSLDELRGALDESLHEHLEYLTHKELTPADRKASEAAVDQCLQRLERRHLQELQEEILASEDTSVPPPRHKEDEIAGVNTRLRELFSHRVR